MKSLFDSFLEWAGKNIGKGVKSLKDSIYLSSLEREIEARRLRRDSLVRRIEIAQEKGDHEEVKRLYIALHLLDSEL